MSKNEYRKIKKQNINQNTNNLNKKGNSISDLMKTKEPSKLIESNFQNYKSNTIQSNIIYKKPSLNNNNSEIYYPEENKIMMNLMKENIKQNESKLEKMNKTMQDIFLKQNKDKNLSKEYYSQINELEKIKQENLSLRADFIIFREDILHLSEINRKLKLEFDFAKKKIFNLISNCENSNQILNNKNYEIAQLAEEISNIHLSNSDETMRKIKNNKTKEQQIYEYEFELNILNNEKIKFEIEIKNLEEKYKIMSEEKNKNEKEEEFYTNRIKENINGLEDKIKYLGEKMNQLVMINKELLLKNHEYENSINILKNEKKIFMDKYNQKEEQFNDLQNNLKILENKYSEILFNIKKSNNEKENEKKQKIKNKKMKSSKQLIVNDLFNKIKELKENIKIEKTFNN